MKNERTVLVDLDMCDEVEYRGYCVTRINPPTCFFTIASINGEAAAPPGFWTSAKEAIAAIDELLGNERKVQK